MEPLKVIRDIYLEQEIEAALDVRVTMTRHGFKVNFGMGTDSNKPTSFDLNEAVLISAKASVVEIQKRMVLITKDQTTLGEIQKSDLLWYTTKRLKFFNEIVKQLSPKPMMPEVDHRIPGVGC